MTVLRRQPRNPAVPPVVSSYPTYEGARRVVDYLSDNKFPLTSSFG